MTELIVGALKWSAIFAAVAIAQWIVVYTCLEPWWRDRIGRSLVSLAVLAGVTPVVFILSLWFEINRVTSQLLAWCEVGVFVVTALLLSWRSVIWIRASRSARDREVE